MAFQDRTDAGRKLAAALSHYRKSRPVVMALPRGGVPVAVEIAAALEAPLDLLLVRRIDLPMQPDVAIGAVVDGGDQPVVLRDDDMIHYGRVSDADFQVIADAESAEVERRRVRYLAGRARPAVHNRVVVLVDDGMVTGATVRAALRALRRLEPARIVLAVPAAPQWVIDSLRREVDELVCLEAPQHFGSVGQAYTEFRAISDGDIQAALSRCGTDFSDAETPRDIAVPAAEQPRRHAHG